MESKVRKPRKHKRIKYKYTSPFVMVSTTPLVSTRGAKYIVRVNTKELTYEIINTSRRNIMRSGNASCYHVLLRRIRRDLDDLGILISHENRLRDYYGAKESEDENQD